MSANVWFFTWNSLFLLYGYEKVCWLLILLIPWPLWLLFPVWRHDLLLLHFLCYNTLTKKMPNRAYCIWLKSSLIAVEGDDWVWLCWEEVLYCHPLQWFGFLCCNIGQWGVTVVYWGPNRELWFSVSRQNKLHPSVLITSKELERAHISTTDRDNETL